MIAAGGGRVLRHRDRVAGPWANGGGITYEVARFPEGAPDFAWRLSVAEVAAEGPFSSYPGIDRTLVLLSGNMQVVLDGVLHEVRPFVPMHFSGETPGHAVLPAGPTMDFNVMVRRGHTASELEVLHGLEVRVEPRPDGHTALFVLSGSWLVDGVEEPLHPWDCVLLTQPECLHGDGLLAHVQLRPER